MPIKPLPAQELIIRAAQAYQNRREQELARSIFMELLRRDPEEKELNKAYAIVLMETAVELALGAETMLSNIYGKSLVEIRSLESTVRTEVLFAQDLENDPTARVVADTMKLMEEHGVDVVAKAFFDEPERTTVVRAQDFKPKPTADEIASADAAFEDRLLTPVDKPKEERPPDEGGEDLSADDTDGAPSVEGDGAVDKN